MSQDAWRTSSPGLPGLGDSHLQVRAPRALPPGLRPESLAGGGEVGSQRLGHGMAP